LDLDPTSREMNFWQPYKWYIAVSLSLIVTEALLICEMLFVRAKRSKTERKLAEQALSMVSRKLIEAQEEERAWLARELHDDIGQRLTLIIVRLGNVKDADTSLVELRQGVEIAMQEASNLATDMQRLSHRLHSSHLEFLGLATAASGYCDEVADQHKVQIDFRAENMPRELPPEISLSIFRILQEALQNAIKHSGAQHFDVSLSHDANQIHLTVQDSGRGFDVVQAMKGRGLGLISMKERVALVAGEISIESQPQNGTTIYVRVPFRSTMN
jgi:signal transduction histidine kinase